MVGISSLVCLTHHAIWNNRNKLCNTPVKLLDWCYLRKNFLPNFNKVLIPGLSQPGYSYRQYSKKE